MASTSSGPDPRDPVGDNASVSMIGVGGPVGTLLRVLRWFTVPVVAIGRRSMYRVFVQGDGFELPIQHTDDKVVGFYTTRFVAASSRLEAESKAIVQIVREWQGLSLMSHFTGTEEPCLTVVESNSIDGWLRRSGGQGFSFYGADPVGSEGNANAV